MADFTTGNMSSFEGSMTSTSAPSTTTEMSAGVAEVQLPSASPQSFATGTYAGTELEEQVITSIEEGGVDKAFKDLANGEEEKEDEAKDYVSKEEENNEHVLFTEKDTVKEKDQNTDTKEGDEDKKTDDIPEKLNEGEVGKSIPAQEQNLVTKQELESVIDNSGVKELTAEVEELKGENEELRQKFEAVCSAINSALLQLHLFLEKQKDADEERKKKKEEEEKSWLVMIFAFLQAMFAGIKEALAVDHSSNKEDKQKEYPLAAAA